MREKLTKALIVELRPEAKDLYVWDIGLAGFGVRVKPSGVKSYILQYRNKYGRVKRVTIGRVGVLTLDQARREATKMRGSVSLGNDPAQERADDRAVESIRDLSERYMQDHCGGRCKESTIKAHRWLLDKFILPKFGARTISELTPQDVARFHQGLRETPYNANRSLGLLKAMYARAEQWGLIDTNSSPAAPIRPYREKKRNRFLTPEEFIKLFEAIEKLERLQDLTPYQAAAMRLLALTGCRLNEILQLTWDEVDFRNERLVLQKHKTDSGGVKGIPLNAEALEILKVTSAKERHALRDCRQQAVLSYSESSQALATYAQCGRTGKCSHSRFEALFCECCRERRHSNPDCRRTVRTRITAIDGKVCPSL